MKSLTFATLLTISAFGFYSCSKERIQEKPQLNSYNSPNTYLDSKQEQEQVFIIDSTGNGPIVGNQGTTIWGTKNCLQFPNGDTVAFPFEVRLVELYTPKQMIYYRMPTVSNKNILETAGEIRLRAFKNNQELLLKPGCAYMISMPNANPQNNYMKVFYGFPNGNFIDWTDNLASLGVTQTQNPYFVPDTIGYNAFVEKLGWINADMLIGNGSGSTLNFTSSVDDLTNVAIFVYFPAYKGLMQAYNQSAGLVPNGSSVKVVAIAVDASNNLYSFDQSLTVNGNTSVSITMSQTTDAALTALLNSL